MSQHQEKQRLVVMSFRKHLVALDARTGERVWTFELGLKSDCGRLLVEDDRVIFVTNGTMFCLDYRSGEALWTTKLPLVVASKPNVLIYARRIVLASQGEAVGFSLKDGAEVWHDKFKGFGIYEGAMAAPGVTAPIDRVQP